MVKECKEALQKHFSTNHNKVLSSQSSNKISSSHSDSEELPLQFSNEALSMLSNAEALPTPYGTGFYPCPANSAVPPGSGPARVHYSFDFTQQVHYPHNPLQPGPMYFKTTRKCAIFGVCCEGIPRQVNYLIDEAFETGKGANTVISLLHHFLAYHAMGEVELHLHADNCVGQNKNNTLLQVHIH